jgi:hypothetical protein
MPAHDAAPPVGRPGSLMPARTSTHPHEKGIRMSTAPAPRLTRSTTLSGIGFIVFFLGGVMSSSPPNANATDAKWVANYTGTSNDWSHVLSGIFLVLAALSLMSFLAGMWQRISSVRPAGTTSPVPLVAAGVAATCMAVGGTLMAYISGSELSGKYALPSPDLLRLSNGLGFVLTGIPGMLATALCLAVLAYQARTAEVFGPAMAIFTWIVAVVLLLSFLFLPIAALMVWIVVAIVGARRGAHTPAAPARHPETQPGVHVSAT